MIYRPPKNNFQIYGASAGSGKTFTLVSEYLKILFKSDSAYSYKNILAITFTNKAAAEMKARILESLQDFSKPSILTDNNALFIKICGELEMEPQLVQKKASRIIKNILNNYAAFNITTIDSFTYKLIRSFAFDLNIALNFEIEMDAIALLNEAVDVLISRIGEDKLLTKTLINFAISKSLEDKSWDISFDLKAIARLLLNENDILQVNKIKQKPIEDFINLQKKIYFQIREVEQQFINIGEDAQRIIESENLYASDFTYGDLPKHFIKMTHLKIDDLKFDGRLSKNIEKDHNQYSSKAKKETQKRIDTVKEELVDLFYESKELYSLEYSSYLLNKLVSRSLIPLAILRTINNVLSEIKQENNIRLLSEFNQLISSHLKEQPAAFIYEKIGERFQHYFIDEMQDTSKLQWENLIPLLDNILSNEENEESGSLLLVGDAKQAIYRWRGGKAEQFIELTSKNSHNPFVVPKKINQLDTNWRSYSEIINFNNSFFKHITKFINNAAYSELYERGNTQKHNTKKGGYVEMQFVPDGLKADEKDEVYPQAVLEIIQNLDSKFDKKDICILTRSRKQGVKIAEHLTENDIDIISSETLLLQNSNKVAFIINLLHFIKQPDDKETRFEIIYFLYHHFDILDDKHFFIDVFLESDNFFETLQKLEVEFDISYFNILSLYESMEYIIRCFRLAKTSDAYVQFFLDIVLTFSIQKTEGLESFLNYWEEKKDTLSIVVSKEKNAVHIMTIHKAKGLEFPVVIYPYDLNIYYQKDAKIWYSPLNTTKFNGFDSSLINYNESLKKVSVAGEELYNKQREELELDNFNLLYVALTRAEEQLYIISEHKELKEDLKLYSHFFIDYLQSIGKWEFSKSVYSFGDSKRISKKQKTTQHNLEQTKCISSDWRQHNIHIIPTQTEDIEREGAQEFGNLVHEILAKIYVASDATSSLQSFINKGLVTKEEQQIIQNRIKKTINHPLLHSYYTKDYKIMNEREILTASGEIIIPDRLAFKGNNVVVIDYKTGKQEKSHFRQINNYAYIIQQMEYAVIGKLLVYIGDEIEVVDCSY